MNTGLTAGASSSSSNPTYVANNTKVVSVSLTRPSNTDAYTANDAVSTSTSAGTVLEFANAARSSGGTGAIVYASLSDSANQATLGSFELWLFSSSPTAINDNAAFAPTDDELLNRIAVIEFKAANTYIGTATSGAGGNVVYTGTVLGSNTFYIPFTASATSLYGLVVVRNAYTPVSAEVFNFKIGVLQD